LFFGNRITSAYFIPGLGSTVESILKHCRVNPQDAAYVVAWRPIILGDPERLKRCVAAFDAWDIPTDEFKVLCCRLDNLNYAVCEPLSPAIEQEYRKEYTQASEVLVPKGSVQIAIDVSDPHHVANPTLVEVVVSTFLNGLSGNAIIRALGSHGHDPDEITEQKVKMVQEMVENGGVNPEIALVQGRSGHPSFDALVYNDGYRDYLSRAVDLQSRQDASEPYPVRRLRPFFSTWATRGELNREIRLLRLIYFNAERKDNAIWYSHPTVLEMVRNSPAPLIEPLLYPLIVVRSSYTTEFRSYPVLNVYCVTDGNEPVFPFVCFSDSIRSCLSYTMTQILPPLRTDFEMLGDIFSVVAEFVHRFDLMSFSMTCKLMWQCYGTCVISSDVPGSYYNHHVFRDYAVSHWTSHVKELSYRTDIRVRFLTFVDYLCYNNGFNPFVVSTMAPSLALMKMAISAPAYSYRRLGSKTDIYTPRKRVRHFSSYNTYNLKRVKLDPEVMSRMTVPERTIAIQLANRVQPVEPDSKFDFTNFDMEAPSDVSSEDEHDCRNVSYESPVVFPGYVVARHVLKDFCHEDLYLYDRHA